MGGAKMDINFAFFPLDGGYVLGVEYSADLFTETTAEGFLHSYHALLSGLLADPAGPAAAVPLMTPAMEQALFAKFASGAGVGVGCACICFAAACRFSVSLLGMQGAADCSISKPLPPLKR